MRQAYFLGARDPYKALKTPSKPKSTAKPGRPCTATPPGLSAKPASGRIAVKVINHLGDEVMKVFRYEWLKF